MARSVSLTTLISDVRVKGDFAGASIRHTDALITRLLNQSIQRFRERISDEGSERYLVSSSGTLGVGPTSPYAFYQLDLSGLSPAMVRPYGIDVTFPGGEIRTLDRVPFEMRSKYGSATQGGTPLAWAPFKDGQIAILPASSTAYPYTVWYLPVLADLSAGGDTFDGVAGHEDFIVWDVVVQLIARDQFPQAYGIATAQRDGVWADILRGAQRVTQAGGAHLGRDSFGGKLPRFLGGRHPVKTAAGGPMVPASGSVTDAMLADMTGPTVKGVLSGTTRPYSIGVATLTTYLSTFSTLWQGVVPLSDGLASSFLRADGVWATPPGGGGGGNSVGPSGAVQYQAGTGFAGASGLRIIGNSPSLLVRLDGSMRVTGGQVEVGSGTVRISASGIDVGGGSVISVGTLVASALAAPAFTDTTSGLAPASGGGTSNYLRADGTWGVPPGTGGGNAAGDTGFVQYRDAVGGFQGASGVRIVASGTALGLGGPTLATQGIVRGDSSFAIFGKSASGADLRLMSVTSVTGTLQFGNTNTPGGLNRFLWTVLPEDASDPNSGFMWRISGATSTTARLMSTGLDLRGFHLAARGLTVSSGIPNTELSPMASGTIKGQLGADGIPQDIPLASLTTALYPFDSTNRGVVPGSGGGSDNYLRADGTWAQPPGTGGAASPGGGTSDMQFRTAAGSFGGASGIRAVASGTALQLGGPTAATQGFVRGGPTMSVYGMHPSLTDVRMLGLSASGSVEVGQTGAAIGLSGDVYAQNLNLTGSGLANSNLQPVGSGMIMGRLTGTGTPQNVPFATFMAFAPTFTAARAGVVPPSDGAATSYLAGNGTWTAPSGAHQFPPAAGVTNAQLAIMSTGTVKGSLAGGAPADVPFATFMAFAPTFTSTRMGVVPASGGGATNYLRADGTWNAPPGTAAAPGGTIGNIQYNNGAGGFAGASGLNVVASGTALGIGNSFASLGDIRGGQSLTAYALSWSGTDVRISDWGGQSGTLLHGDTTEPVTRQRFDVGTGGRHEFAIGGATATTARLLGTGLDLSGFHIKAKSIDVAHLNGLPADFAGLKRFSTNLITNVQTGLPSGLSLYPPRGAASGGNRFIIPSGAVPAARTITIQPSGGKAGEVIRIERHGTEGFAVTISPPSGSALHVMPSGTKSWVDLMFEKPSGATFQLAGHADMF